MKVRFWGVRGSIPAPGPETNRYGGNTSCVSVECDGQLFICDMGTGITGLGGQLLGADMGKGKGEATVLLSHAHWDHIQGFPFFPPVFIPGNRFHIYGNAHSSDLLEGILEGQMNPHFSPIYTIKNLGAAIAFTAVSQDEIYSIGSVALRAHSNPHGHTQALAFRLEHEGRSLIYASDVGYPESGIDEDTLAFYRGADILIHDSTYTPAERATRLERGNSSYADAAAAACNAGVGHLVLFHYDQDYSDEVVDQMVRDCRAELDRLGCKDIELTAACEGLELTV